MSQAVSKRIAVILFARLVLVATTLVFSPTHLFAQAVLNPSLSSIIFGNQQINVESDPITLTLYNIGNESATGIICEVSNRAEAHDSEMFTAGTCPASLAYGASFTVDVTFTPTSMGSKGAQLLVTYNDGSTVTATSISLDGTGTEGPCNVNTITSTTEHFDVVHEACEVLVLGPDFIAAEGAIISASSGWEIDFLPGFTVEQGATLSANVCGQSLCETSPAPMPLGCHSCVDLICASDASCCAIAFDPTCLDMVDSVCGLVCE